ncbi:helix-turn-helix domain-containing protein [Schinkia azotoformans]|uniref:helix-turn-helix domain-containing protein n=1 Tax=Schinkia azotoformans TaxID=1454 RepID=UPI002DBA911A|nr:helix-turn-helix transcriptional regulator [Schinkia azotoformans]MEC1714780.1 helix-turn-helix transcriptional regulator [Schinkia azotoformans]MEC1757464.1 helix-turn-helix transcriptional regulator [Schinkia azotoformans]
MFGLGKKRSSFGKFLDQNGITQQELSKASGVNRNSISRIASDSKKKPSMTNGSKLINTLKKAGFKVDYDDFWSM